MKRNLLFLLMTFLLTIGSISLKAQSFDITYGTGDAAYTLTYTPIDGTTCSVKCTKGNGPSAPTEITIPQTINNGTSTYTVTTIPDSGFDGASTALNGSEDNFTKLVLPNSIISIGEYAFYGWAGLTELHLGTSVNTTILNIAKNAFNETSNITSIYCYYTTPPTTNISSSFNSTVKNNAIVYIPKEIYKNYINIQYTGESINWNTFKNIVEYTTVPIYLNTSSEEITTCDNVTFTVSQGTGTGDDVTTECKVYQENGTGPATELTDKTFVPTAAGTYRFYATMGTQESERVEIIVDEADYELNASATTVVVNNAVVFSVEQCNKEVEGFTFYVDEEAIGGNTFTPTETGDYSVKAMKGTEAETQSITIKVIEESEWYFTGDWATNDLFAKKLYDYENIAIITNDSCTLWMAITGDEYDNGIILNNNVVLSGNGGNESYDPRSGHRPKTPQPLSLPETIYIDENYGSVTITEIADEVFYDQFDNTGADALGNSSNVNISDITLPKTITKIGKNAFSFNTATNAQKVYINCKATKVPEIKESTFSNNVYQKYTLLLPASSFESYKADPYWKKFFNYNTPEIDPESILIFTGNGDWTDEENWNIYPTESDMVTINGNVEITTDITVNGMIINSGYKVNVMENGVLTVNGDITKEENSDIVIEDGGQLYYNGTGEIEVTMKKAIKGYGSNDNVTGWYTISSPVYSEIDLETYEDAPYYYVNISDVTNLTNYNYDLYRYYEYGETGEEGWWENYKKGDEQLDENFPEFNLSNGQGYLYASSNDVTLEFTGKVITDTIIHHCYRMNTNEDFKGFNLIGNPYTHNITGEHLTNLGIADGFYTVDNAGTWTTHSLTDTIKPAQGMLVQVTEELSEGWGFINIVEKKPSITSKNLSTNKSFSIDITNEKFSDRAFVSFSEGHGLNKYPHLNKEAHEVYIPVDGVDYAVATMNEDVKEIPISFEAKTFGQYTIGVKTQDCDFNTMTLIDKLTGNETNLLTDTYTFFARTTDNPNRFTLTLNNDNDNDNDNDFIYINNGEMIINNIEGNGHIVVYDIMGRPMAEYNVSGSANISIESFANGVYIVRMTDDNGVKTQKIIRN